MHAFIRFVTACLAVSCLVAAQAEEVVPAPREFLPKGDKGRLAVVISGQSGTNNYADLAKEVAGHGYFVVLVDGNDYWIKGGGGENLLRSVIERAQQSPHAQPGKAAVIGFSLGGAVSLAYAARMPDIVSAVAAFYPATYFISDAEGFVAKNAVPVLMFAGGRDTYKNCCLIETARKIATAAKAAPGAGTFEVVEYPQADHAFVLRGRQFRAGDYLDAMRRTYDHLDRHAGNP